jgi:hypothetical protein
MSLTSGFYNAGEAKVAYNDFPEPKRRGVSAKYIKDPTIARARAIAYYRQRLDGMTKAQIALFWCVSPSHVQKYINGLPAAIRDQIRIQRLRTFRVESEIDED